MKIRDKLITKIKSDTGIEIPRDAQLTRFNLTWSQSTSGRNKWYFYFNGKTVGSQENMIDLLRCKKIEDYTPHYSVGDTTLYSS